MREFSSPFKRNFENLIRQEGLDKLDELMTTSTFEEVPLCSRHARLAFLDNLPVDEKNRLLIQAAAWYLPTIVEYSRTYFAGRPYDYFCMLSVSDWESFDEGDLVRVSFWYTNPSHRVLDLLNHEAPRSKYSQFVADALGDGHDFELTEGMADLPGGPYVQRVYARQRR